MAEVRTPVFRAADGNLYTQSLFLELSYDDPSVAIYTLKRNDYEYNGVKYLSFPRLYLEIADPTEYEVANRLFDGWPHWQRLRGNSRIAVVIDGLKEELEVKLRSEGIRKVIQAAKTKGSESAAKWLADRGWEAGPVGRPTKERIKQEAKKLSKIQEEVASDIKRLTNQ